MIPGVTRLGPAVEWQIVGVYPAVRNGGPRGDFPEIDVPFAQSPWPGTVMAVRTTTEPDSARKALAAAVQSLDPNLPMADVKTMDQMVHESLAGDRFQALLFGGFAAVALVLAALGIYGVMSFAVAQRTHEIGLRMALGAGREQVVRQILREGMITALAGVAIGTVGAYLVGRAMQGMWFGVGVVDPDGLLRRRRTAARLGNPRLSRSGPPRRVDRSDGGAAAGVKRIGLSRAPGARSR